MVSVLLSTYNGAKFLREQIDSILEQSYSDFLLYIRDDGSSDDTWSVLSEYNDPRIRLVQGENLGPAGSFFTLLREAERADYYFFSDQDDVWYSEKISVMLAEIQKYDDYPAMVFSDFSMIDETGSETHQSYSLYASLRVSEGEVGVDKLIPHPYVFGCASVINQKLAKLVLFPPDGIEMHDCWISMAAAATGKLIYLPRQTIAHRFHSSNATGRKDQTHPAVRLRRLLSGFSAQAENSKLRLHQVNLLLQCYDGILLPHVETMLEALSNAMSRGKISTVLKLIELGMGRQKSLNSLFFYLTVLGIKGEIR